MMETADLESKVNDDCSDDDVNKGSDDVDNDVPKNMTDTHSKLFNKRHILCYGTLVSVTNIVITISICVTTVFILPDYQKNGSHLIEGIFRISDKLESLSTELKTSRSQSFRPTKIENIFHDNHVLQKQNRRLKSELKKEKSQRNSITCTDAFKKRIQSTESLFVSRTNYVYGWVFGNKSLTFGRTDNFDIDIKIKLLYPEIPDNDKILFEFGLTTMIDYFNNKRPVITVKGQRCVKSPGVCLYVLDDTVSKLEGPHFEQTLDYIQGKITLELHKSHFFLMSNLRDIYKSNVLNISFGEKLWPVFGFYNIHLINISQTIFSENKLSFNRTTVDPHLFVSEDNNTIANYKLQYSSRWHIIITYLEIAVATMFLVIVFFLKVFPKPINILLNIAGIVVLCHLVLLALFYLYMNLSLILVWLVGLWLSCVIRNPKNERFESNLPEFILVSILFSTFMMSFCKAISHIYYVIFF